MSTAYFDCYAGISGDMILGAIIDAGYSADALKADLNRLGIEGLELEVSKVERHGLSATSVRVRAPHDQVHRSLDDILSILSGSGLGAEVRERAAAIFQRLAEAESDVHGIPVKEVHFHEVGAVDAIADVVGAVSGLRGLGVNRIFASQLRFGTGETRGSHGSLPIPVPAVVALCRHLPTQRTSLPFELVTPTGAAILTTLADGIGESVVMKTRSIGYGAGSRDPEQIANVLRLEIGECIPSTLTDALVLIETNIDDMTPEIYGYLIDRLLESGARDAWLVPVIMKKSRPGVVVSVLAEGDDVDALTDVLFKETTTIGVRTSRVSRRVLPRRSESVLTQYGEVKIKRITVGEDERIAPEFEDCARIARERSIPILQVYRAVDEADRASGNKKGG